MKILITALYFAAFSFHSNCGDGCNQNNNPAFGVQFVYRNANYIALVYNNSNSSSSFLLARREKYYFYGAVTGYKDIPVPFAAPIVSIGPVDVSCLTDFNQSVCVAAIKWRF